MAGEVGFSELREVDSEARPRPSAPAAWKIVLVTTLVGPITAVAWLSLMAAALSLATNQGRSIKIGGWPELMVYVLVIGAIASFASGVGSVWQSREQGWLRLHHTMAIAAVSCLAPSMVALVLVPFLHPILVGYAVTAILPMLPVALISAMISRPIILWLLDWKRPVTA